VFIKTLGPFSLKCAIYLSKLDSCLKGYSTQKWQFCHDWLILKLLQPCMSFLLLLNTKGIVLMNDWNFWHHWLP